MQATEDGSDYVKIADAVTVNVRHTFTREEQEQNSALLVKAVQEKENQENEKKVAMAAFKSVIETQVNEIKKFSGYLYEGFTYMDKTAEIYLNHKTKQREYRHKETGELLKTEDFRTADYQKKLDFEKADAELEEQIRQNNEAGDYAEGDTDEAPVISDPAEEQALDDDNSSEGGDDLFAAAEDDIPQ